MSRRGFDASAYLDAMTALGSTFQACVFPGQEGVCEIYSADPKVDRDPEMVWRERLHHAGRAGRAALYRELVARGLTYGERT